MQGKQKDYFMYLHSGIRTIKSAAPKGNALFNEGYAAIFKVMKGLKIKIGPQCKQYADSYDAELIKYQERASLNDAKEPRVVRIINQIQVQEFFEESERFLYGPRIVD